MYSMLDVGGEPLGLIDLMYDILYLPSSKDLWNLEFSDGLELEYKHLHHLHEDVTTLLACVEKKHHRE